MLRAMRDAGGQVVGGINCFLDVTHEHDMRLALERQQRTFDLAMVASKMGTWRYSMADNVCLYDENAQRLYGLTEARFLHDTAGVEAKFHPDDMDLMWARVARAIDPESDGRYEVEYRVKQTDGSWRWLSAWGLVEFEGRGAERQPVAIAGASRDLTELKKSEELQRLLTNELNHRVKNSLATVQSIVNQTLRDATNVQAARRDDRRTHRCPRRSTRSAHCPQLEGRRYRRSRCGGGRALRHGSDPYRGAFHWMFPRPGSGTLAGAAASLPPTP